MKHIERVRELIHQELDDYSHFEEWKLEMSEEYNGFEYYDLDIQNARSTRLRANENKIEVEMGEDNFYEIEWFEPNIKYFWMSILWN